MELLRFSFNTSTFNVDTRVPIHIYMYTVFLYHKMYEFASYDRLKCKLYMKNQKTKNPYISRPRECKCNRLNSLKMDEITISYTFLTRDNSRAPYIIISARVRVRTIIYFSKLCGEA